MEEIQNKKVVIMMKFEYKAVSYAGNYFSGEPLPHVDRHGNKNEVETYETALSERLNKLGAQGWELVCDTGSHNILIFKRSVSK
jgi:hypothetical protein